MELEDKKRMTFTVIHSEEGLEGTENDTDKD